MAWRVGCCVLVLLAGLTSAVQAVPLTVTCKQSLSDGKLLVDSSFVPRGRRYKVLQYTPDTREAGWSLGKCQIIVVEGVPAAP